MPAFSECRATLSSAQPAGTGTSSTSLSPASFVGAAAPPGQCAACARQPAARRLCLRSCPHCAPVPTALLSPLRRGPHAPAPWARAVRSSRADVCGQKRRTQLYLLGLRLGLRGQCCPWGWRAQSALRQQRHLQAACLPTRSAVPRAPSAMAGLKQASGLALGKWSRGVKSVEDFLEALTCLWPSCKGTDSDCALGFRSEMGRVLAGWQLVNIPGRASAWPSRTSGRGLASGAG